MSRLDMWSRRKAAVQAEAEAEERALKAVEVEAQEKDLAERTDEEILKDLGLPDPDSLVEGDDFKVFLQDVVPVRLKTRALRRLWRVNPVLANIDGLVDYGEDFTDAAMVIENMQTAYQVGKGMTMHVEELARQAEEEGCQESAEQPEEQVLSTEIALGEPDQMISENSPGQIALETAESHAEKAVDEVSPHDRPASTAVSEEIDLEMSYTAPRRMRFRFNESQETA